MSATLTPVVGTGLYYGGKLPIKSKLCLSLFCWKVNILYKESIVQSTAQAIVKGTIYIQIHLVRPHYKPTFWHDWGTSTSTWFLIIWNLCVLHCIAYLQTSMRLSKEHHNLQHLFNGSMHRWAEQSVTLVLGLYSFEEGVIRWRLASVVTYQGQGHGRHMYYVGQVRSVWRIWVASVRRVALQFLVRFYKREIIASSNVPLS